MSSAYARFRPNFSEIIPGKVWLGNLSTALSQKLLTELGITHIVSVCPEYPSTGDNHLQIAVDDCEYSDILIHLPQACEFIENALSIGGKVLVHCVMGISRSATVVSAYLMKTHNMTSTAAIAFTRKARASIRPNYGFIKQLEVFAQCGYDPNSHHPSYISWKRSQQHHITSFLNRMVDTTAIIPDRLYLSSEFPDDPRQAESLLVELGITHMLSVSPENTPALPENVVHRRIQLSGARTSELLTTLSASCEFVDSASAEGDMVLVHCNVEARACIVAAAYLMVSERLSVSEACDVIEERLPLFARTANVKQHLELFEQCEYEPCEAHPLVVAWDGQSTSPAQSMSSDSLMASLSASLLGETGLDIGAFGKTLESVAAKSQKSHTVKPTRVDTATG
ncbi:DSPc-domain-containing protein [Cylindrobasidium torrendii FP15055 ss-10]|uniref:protein-tyrosine-phosphatase n=1 Tax=Cylindrobasidium torrendii FP15055 ss-10 TaxID=1314674 RepID=A0A0D7B699_9AGAR|nr:DSPc-domain-containing protein [Cylindrobasidium torrendii FP15055 ss-10]